jgi:hypothetical protein
MKMRRREDEETKNGWENKELSELWENKRG